MYEIQRMTTRQRHEEQTGTYRELIGIAEEVVESARMVLEKTRKARGKDMLADITIEEIRKNIEHYCGLGSHVIDQARRRVLNGEQVPSADKIYSIFGPHTDLIKRGKVRTPIEFGHKVFLAESAQGLITQYEVVKGNPSDDVHVAPSLERHMEAFGRAPKLYGSDRGFFSEQNVASCAQDGVTVVCIPQRGGKKTPEREAYEKSADFKVGQRFRAGIEGRISVLFRGRGMKRCLAEGHERFELWVAAAVAAAGQRSSTAANGPPVVCIACAWPNLFDGSRHVIQADNSRKSINCKVLFWCRLRDSNPVPPSESQAPRPLVAMPWQRPNNGSRMNREVHVRFWESPEVKVLRATRQAETCRTPGLTGRLSAMPRIRTDGWSPAARRERARLGQAKKRQRAASRI
jgi:hypothetical protein